MDRFLGVLQEVEDFPRRVDQGFVDRGQVGGDEAAEVFEDGIDGQTGDVRGGDDQADRLFVGVGLVVDEFLAGDAGAVEERVPGRRAELGDDVLADLVEDEAVHGRLSA
ncbi:MAG: hypothetical protein M3R09_07100, partial [Actinomycetota bacterium]|nr:hypothetical protein [Actinomycetota bacterium]